MKSPIPPFQPHHPYRTPAGGNHLILVWGRCSPWRKIIPISLYKSLSGASPLNAEGNQAVRKEGSPFQCLILGFLYASDAILSFVHAQDINEGYPAGGNLVQIGHLAFSFATLMGVLPRPLLSPMEPVTSSLSKCSPGITFAVQSLHLPGHGFRFSSVLKAWHQTPNQ